MEILACIKDLILLHDCVIIPGLGGFVTNYKPAKVRNSNFNPPSKAISFYNKHKFNDGLFINYIAEQEGFDYITASKKIKSLVQEMNYRLADGERISIAEIGDLSYNEGDQLIFEPVQSNNLNLDAFGLATFRYESLYAKKLARTVSKENRDAVEVIFQNRSLKKVMIGIPLMIALAFFPIKDNKENIQQSDLSVIAEMMTPAEPAKELKPEVISTTEEKSVENSHFIIGGSFRSKENADRFLNEKLAEGFEAQNLGLIKGLNYISLGGFPNFASAKAKQLEIKAEFPQSGVWIYAKK